MPQLVITARDGRRSTVRVDPRRAVTIGRSRENDIVLTDPQLSRHHAELIPDGDHWLLRDRGSHNGTYLDGRRIDIASDLCPGSSIRVGSYVVEFDPSGSSHAVVFSEPAAEPTTDVELTADTVTTSPDAILRLADDDRPDERERFARRLRLLEDAHVELLGDETLEILHPKVLDIITRAVRPDRAALLLRSPEGELRCHAYVGSPPDSEVRISRHIAERVMDGAVSVLASDARTDPRFDTFDSVVGLGLRSIMAVPLRYHDESIGLIYVDSHRVEGLFEEDDLRILAMLANVAAIGIANARLQDGQRRHLRYVTEIRAASALQRRLLPAGSVVLPGHEIAGWNVPCYEVGGDYFDFVELDDGRCGVVLADVSGKGLAAAMLTMGLHATFRARATVRPEPEDLLRYLNVAMLHSAPRNRFVTLFYALLDPSSATIRWVNAGHAPSPVVIRRSGRLERLVPGGVPLGILPDVQYPVGEISLEPGDVVFACSDGITETIGAEGRSFGDAGLADVLKDSHGRAPGEIYAALGDRIEAIADGAAPPDDRAVVIIRRDPSASGSRSRRDGTRPRPSTG